MREVAVDSIVTTAFEVLAVLLIATAVAVALWSVHPALALAGAGVALVAQSAVIQRWGVR